MPGDEPISARSQEELSEEITLTDDLTKAFQEATNRHSAINATFERAQEFLISHLQSIFLVRSEARAAAQFLTHCMRSDGGLYMYAWNREKSAVLASVIENLGGAMRPKLWGMRELVSYFRENKHLRRVLSSGLCFGHQQGKEDEAAESNRCQGDETDGVTEHLYDKARTEVT
jgi:hypothetical protein